MVELMGVVVVVVRELLRPLESVNRGMDSSRLIVNISHLIPLWLQRFFALLTNDTGVGSCRRICINF